MDIDLAEFTGKKVTVVTGGDKSQDGTVEAGSAVGIVFKPKGTSKTELIEAHAITDISEIEAGPKKLKARTLPQVTDGKHREHLIERHGYKVSEISAMTDAQAKEFHASIDHSDLGHKHRELTEAEKAIAAASADEPDEDADDDAA